MSTLTMIGITTVVAGALGVISVIRGGEQHPMSFKCATALLFVLSATPVPVQAQELTCARGPQPTPMNDLPTLPLEGGIPEKRR